VPRIVGVDIPKNKSILISLTYIYGIGKSLSSHILQKANIDPQKHAKDLSDDEVSRLASIIQSSYKVEGDLRREISLNIRRLQETGSYRGTRHKRGLPARGQRTRTNARTRKGPRKTVGVLRKKEDRGVGKYAREKE
jgi:small subunit ribosomal protein S13